MGLSRRIDSEVKGQGSLNEVEKCFVLSLNVRSTVLRTV